MISIYALVNPINNSVFYIGASMSPKNRFAHHCSNNDGSYKAEMIYNLYQIGIKPELLVLDQVTYEEASFYEDFYTDLFRSFGFTIKTPKSAYKGGLLSTYQKKRLIEAIK